MANYLYIFRGGNMKGLSPQQMEENMKQWGAWIGELSKTGNFKAGDPLGDDARVVAGRRSRSPTVRSARPRTSSAGTSW